MLTEHQKKSICLYSVLEHNRKKAERRIADATEVAAGNAKAVQERNRALPHASLFVFDDTEKALPTETTNEKTPEII